MGGAAAFGWGLLNVEDGAGAAKLGDGGVRLRLDRGGWGRGGGDDFLLAGDLLDEALAGGIRGCLEIDGGGICGEVGVHAGEFGAAFGAALEVVADGGGVVRGEELHRVEGQVVPVGWEAAPELAMAAEMGYGLVGRPGGELGG